MIVSNLKLVVFPNPNREDPGKALRDWDLWGPFFFIVFLGLMLSWSPSVKKSKASLDSALLLAFDLIQRTDSHLMSMIQYAINHIVKFTIKCCSHSEVFVVAFALLTAVAVILTLNVSSPRRSICGFKKENFLLLAKRPEAAAIAFRAAQNLRSDLRSYQGHFRLSTFLFGIWQNQRSVVYLGAAIALADLHLMEGRNGDAVSLLERYLKDWADESLYAKLAQVFAATNMLQDSLSHYQAALSLGLLATVLIQVGNKDSVVQINGVGDMSLKSLMKDGFVFEHDFFICGIKFLSYQKKVKEKRTFVP
ncbi:unnamed protein product [Brassica napus]|uniref:(rape) hypothetical protein n=1 Tax=Brassica napus TaxID=3708 RepID=A0A816JK93_BRANA|nr:unnamed protein product [Brassica napus]